MARDSSKKVWTQSSVPTADDFNYIENKLEELDIVKEPQILSPLPITKGGTGASSAQSARDNLGLGNVDNTADRDKFVNYAASAGLANTYKIKHYFHNKPISEYASVTLTPADFDMDDVHCIVAVARSKVLAIYFTPVIEVYELPNGNWVMTCCGNNCDGFYAIALGN